MTEIHLRAEDRAFIEEQMKGGNYESLDEVVTAGIRMLRRYDTDLRQLLQEGLDDIDTGRVHSYDTPEDFLRDIKRLSSENAPRTGDDY